MNGAEHYRRAEEILARLSDKANAEGKSDAVLNAAMTITTAMAQVHATLALAAATALTSTHHYVGDSREITDWARIAQPDAMATKPCPDGCRDIHGDGCLPRCIDIRNTRDAQAAKHAPIDEEPPF